MGWRSATEPGSPAEPSTQYSPGSRAWDGWFHVGKTLIPPRLVDPVGGREAAKSIGHEHTFDVDTSDREVIERTLLGVSEGVAGRLGEQDGGDLLDRKAFLHGTASWALRPDCAADSPWGWPEKPGAPHSEEDR